MRNIVPALLSIVVGFAIAFFGLQAYSNSISKKPVLTANKAVTSSKEKPNTTRKETKTKSNKKETVATENSLTAEEKPTVVASYDASNIQKSFDNWEAYTKDNIDLMSTYTPLDDSGAVLEKGIFLTLLRTGAYIPIKSEKKGKIQYRLTDIKKSADEKIKKSIVSKASIAHQYFRMERKKLPDYNFVDITGKAHNKADTKGKILVLKCWFITCKICVEEFPELNALVDKYKDSKIEFVSLAFDKKEDLTKFLAKKDFKYATIPDQKDFMVKKLKVKQYPTHIIVDANGVVIKMVNNVKTLTSELERIMGK